LSLGWNPSLSSAIGYVSGIGVSYFINKRFVFAASKKASFWKYSIAYLFALGSQLVLLNIFIWVSVEVRLANAIAIIIVVFLNFLVMRKFVF
jgi:putative flippase GtrA